MSFPVRTRSLLVIVLCLLILLEPTGLLSMIASGQSAEEEILNPDTLIHAAATEPTSLDPAVRPWGINGEIIFNVYETLIFWDGEDPNSLIPQLSTFVPSVDNGLILEYPDGSVTYQFPIRQGVKFHTGDDLTAEDVEYSFERSMIQDEAGRMILEPLLGVNSMDKLAEQYGDFKACEMVKKAVWVEGGTVIFRLVAPFTPFLQILAHPLASIVDKEWAMGIGGWMADSDNWRKWQYSDSLYSVMNGTGAFKLEEWISGNRITLQRFEDYWNGPAVLERFIVSFVANSATRVAMLQAGDADIISIPTGLEDQYASTLIPLMEEGTVFSPRGLPLPKQDAVFFNQAVDQTSPYIGSGRLDGQGIPPDFFSDIELRTAFNYAFDWDTFIQAAFHGEAWQSTGPIPEGLFDLEFGNPVYTHDLQEAGYYFKQARGGEVWRNGFKFSVVVPAPFNEWRIAVEILKANIERLSPKFVMEIVVVDYASYFALFADKQLPIFMQGRLGDYHDPHNWVWSFMHSNSSFAQWQGISNPEWDQLIEEAAQNLDPEKRKEIYGILQREAYDEAIAVWLCQPLGSCYFRSWVQGWYNNPAYPTGSFRGILAKAYRKAKASVEFITEYGREAYYAVSQYGPKAVNAVLAYGKPVLDISLEYGADALDIICVYGEAEVILIVDYGKYALEILTTYGWKGSRAIALVRELVNLLSQIETQITSYIKSLEDMSKAREKAERMYDEFIGLARQVAAQYEEVKKAEELTGIISGYPKPITDWAKKAMSAWAGSAVDVAKLGLVPGPTQVSTLAASFKYSEELKKKELRRLFRVLMHKWDAMAKAYDAIGVPVPRLPDVGTILPRVD